MFPIFALFIVAAVARVDLAHLLLMLPIVGLAVGVFTHSITTGYKSDEGTITSVVKTFTGDSETGIEDTLALGATNTHYALAITIAQIKSMVLYASKAVTIKTNSSTTPQETITLAAGQQMVWTNDGTLGTIPFAGNITAFYVTNTDTAASNLKMRFLLAV